MLDAFIRRQGDLPVEFRDRSLPGIVGLEVEIARVAGKFKLRQNRQAVGGVRGRSVR